MVLNTKNSPAFAASASKARPLHSSQRSVTSVQHGKQFLTPTARQGDGDLLGGRPLPAETGRRPRPNESGGPALTSSSSLSLGFSSDVCLTKSGMRISSVARAAGRSTG